VKPTIPGRVHAQGLDRPRLGSAVEVVRHLCCVQSQLPDMALWAVARRTGGLTLADLQASFDRGDVVRTHVLRPTWHLVDVADVPWLQALTGPRVERLMAASNRTIDLTADTVQRSVEVVVEAVADDEPRTRSEIADRLAEAGLPSTGQALAHVVMQAEIEARIVSGPMRGRQHTYRPLAPRPVTESRDELLARVATRYARGHGPFRDRDLAWWTSLTLTDSRRAIELAGMRPVEHTDAADDGYWTLDDPVLADAPLVMLLPNFDEYISYARDPDDFAVMGGSAADIMRGAGLVMVRGRLAGTWSRAVTAREVAVSVDVVPRLTRAVRAGIEREADAFGRFLSRDVTLTITG